jgi:1,4-dihydroxy-2-naphthoate octaprenyltransferase
MHIKKLNYWVQAVRPQFFVASLLPALIGIRLASHDVSINWVIAALSIAGAVGVHFATNVANDYYDHLQGVDEGGASSGSRVIQEGKLLPEELKRCFLIAYGVCILIGIPIILSCGWPVLLFGLAGLFVSFFYVGPPLRLEYHGWGEAAVGIGMGPLIVLGSYYVQTGHVGFPQFFISLPIGVLVAGILYVQSLPDLDHDRRHGKVTLLARLGARRAAWGVGVMWLVAYLLTAAVLFTGIVSKSILWIYLSLPAAVVMTLSSIRKVEDLTKASWEGKLMVGLYLYCAVVYLISV